MAEAIYHFRPGDFDCTTINEGTRPQEAERIFGHIAAQERATHEHRMLMGDHYPKSGRGYVAPSGDHQGWQPVLSEGDSR